MDKNTKNTLLFLALKGAIIGAVGYWIGMSLIPQNLPIVIDNFLRVIIGTTISYIGVTMIAK